MQKMYMVGSLMASDGVPTGLLTGVNAPDWGATPDMFVTAGSLSNEDSQEVHNKLREYGYSPDSLANLLDAYGDEGTGDTAALFKRRKDARAVADRLNKQPSWDWRVIEVGEATPRDVRPVLGWQIIYDGDFASAYNASAYKQCPEDMIELPNGEYAFKSRARARAFFRERVSPYNDEGYTIEPVYTAWRVDPKCGETYELGHLRFRTKREAEGFARDIYGAYGEGYRVLLHDWPVSEDCLYTPVKFE